MSSFSQAVSQLREVHARIVVDQIKAGRIISEFMAQVKHGRKISQLQKLCKSAGISQKTAYNYQEAFEDSQRLGKPVIEAAEKAGLKINRRPVREKLEEVKALNPKADPTEIVKFTKSQLNPSRKSGHEEPEELNPSERQKRLFAFAEKLYWNVASVVRERELKELADKLLDHFRLDDPETEAA
ncbi:MAG: hypothetical protein WAM96_07695 [Candidatus Acidiferrales bacterium]